MSSIVFGAACRTYVYGYIGFSFVVSSITIISKVLSRKRTMLHLSDMGMSSDHIKPFNWYRRFFGVKRVRGILRHI